MKHPLGCHRIGTRCYFTLYAPYAKSLKLAIFSSCQDEKPLHLFPMRRLDDGFWEYSDVADIQGLYYAYLIDDNKHFTADPYARALATFNDYRQDAKGYIDFEPYDWEGDDFIPIADPRDLLIYECHLRDLTAHPAEKIPQAGSYEAAHSRIAYFKELGINAVEFLPLMLFANHEPPFRQETEKVFNYWNPYAYNHWGYMSSFFFAPANIYVAGAGRAAGDWCDPKGRDVRALKDLIKALHREGIAVILDVVYNHISQYNRNPLRDLAEDQYLKLGQNFSGCGNDVNSESLMMRKLILDSVEYWLREYHIDGFRLDLAGILDDVTLSLIREKALAINPYVQLMGEPWGKRYFPERMSSLGYGVWNDRFRNGLKGESPRNRPGFLLEAENPQQSPRDIFTLLSGSRQDDGGLVLDSRFTVNYLESHDGYTMGDFFRIHLRNSGLRARENLKEHLQLSERENRLHRMAAFSLCCSQGILMIHAGQEFARSKVIAAVPGIEDPQQGEMDIDSYSKDNETNYLQSEHMQINADLFAYYCALFKLRKKYPELRKAEREHIHALYDKNNTFAVGYRVDSPERSLAVFLNASTSRTANFIMDDLGWRVLADIERVHEKGQVIKEPDVLLEASSVLLLLKEKE